MRRVRGFVAVVLVLGAALPVRAIPRAVQRERDEIFTLLAYSTRISTRRRNGSSRGAQHRAVLLTRFDAYWGRNCVNDGRFPAHAEVPTTGYVHAARVNA